MLGFFVLEFDKWEIEEYNKLNLLFTTCYYARKNW